MIKLKVENPNREKDERYYNNVIKSRFERMKNVKEDERDREKAMEEVKENLAQCKAKYEKSMKELEVLQNTLNEKLLGIQKDIDTQKEDKRRIEKNALDTFEKIGLQGSTLITCLTQVRSFAQSLKPGASAYAPLASILTRILVYIKFHDSLMNCINFQKSDLW